MRYRGRQLRYRLEFGGCRVRCCGGGDAVRQCAEAGDRNGDGVAV